MKRAKTDIIFDMLRAMEAKGGKIKPTHLLYKSNLSHQRMKLYLDELKQKEMVKDSENEGKLVYEITDKGRWFLQNFKQMKAFTEAFGL